MSEGPRPGQPRLCKVVGCGTLFVPGISGSKGMCSRCYQAARNKRTPGPRKRTGGTERVLVKVYVPGELCARLTEDLLRANGALNERGEPSKSRLLVLALEQFLTRSEGAKS